MKLTNIKKVLLAFLPPLVLVILSLSLSRLSLFSLKKITCQLDQYPAL